MKSSNSTAISLSVIISTKDRFDKLRLCVESILHQTVLPDEVVIVDGSTEIDLRHPIEDLFREAHSDLLKYIKSLPSLTVQNNSGIKNSIGDLITILDDDVVLDKDYILCTKDFYNNNSDLYVGALSTKIIDSDTTVYKEHFSISELIGKMFLLWHTRDGKFQLSGIPTLISPDCNELKKVDFIFGGNATYPRSILEEFQFDEHLPMGFMMSDDDLAYRISRKYQNYWTPKTFVYHKTHYVNNDRYKKSKEFIMCHFYLKRKNHPGYLKNNAAFYWSVLGKIILETYISIKIKNLTGLNGTFSGLINVWREKQ